MKLLTTLLFITSAMARPDPRPQRNWATKTISITTTYSAVTNASTTMPPCPASSTKTVDACDKKNLICPMTVCVTATVQVVVVPTSCEGLEDTTETYTSTCRCGCPTKTTHVFATETAAAAV